MITVTTRGSLYIVSTPIGNLGDISYRAVDVLTKVNLIAAEDTRVSGVLLKHYDIHTPLTSFHSHNQINKTPALLKRLHENEDVAVISDAGTPGISDPAYYLVKKAIEEDVPVSSIPGASALLAGLVVSGLPTNRFAFEGFLPVKKGRKKRLESLASEEKTIVLFESPHRLKRTLSDLHNHLGIRRLSIARELTKIHEEIIRTTTEKAPAIFEKKPARGEFVLIIEGHDRKKRGFRA